MKIDTRTTLKVNSLLQGNNYIYHIEQVLGQGSFGITYLATTKIKMSGDLGTIETEVRVAIKEFFMKEFNSRNDDGTIIETSNNTIVSNYQKKFRKEAENLAKLSHPNIVKVLEVFDSNNTCYYAMQYISGGNLDDYVKIRGGLPENEAIDCIRQIGLAVSYMHDHKMLHLDLKPSNVMNDAGKMVLIDFGLSKQYDSKGAPESSTTIGLGTPGYAPLEQSYTDREKDFAPTLDVYALGATFYKLLSAETPPNASEVNDGGLQIDNLKDKGISDVTICAIESAMEPRKSKRIKTVKELLSLLPSPQKIIKEEIGEKTDFVTISLDKSSLSIHEGTCYQLFASTTSNTHKTILWSSSNPNVALVDNNGNVRANKSGTTEIIANCEGVKAICKVTVVKQNRFKPYLSWIISSIVALGVILGINYCQRGSAENDTSNKINGHEYVDLGLPSGTLWATCNVGASSPSDCGNYYAWGETSTKSSYDWKNLKYDISGYGDEFSKYVANSKYGDIDNKTRLKMQDDAARANWGGSWRMPSKEEWVELKNNCTWQWTSQGGHNGYKVTSNKNSNSIFLPAAGLYDGSSLLGVGDYGNYWSSSLYAEISHYAYECRFYSSGVGPSRWDDRCNGRSVRPVSSSSQN